MRRNADRRYRGGFYWRCAVKDRGQSHAYYYERMPTSVRYGPRYLKNRHAKALKRRRERQLRRAES